MSLLACKWHANFVDRVEQFILDRVAILGLQVVPDPHLHDGFDVVDLKKNGVLVIQ